MAFVGMDAEINPIHDSKIIRFCSVGNKIIFISNAARKLLAQSGRILLHTTYCISEEIHFYDYNNLRNIIIIIIEI